MDSINELLAYIVAILFFGLPLITWLLVSSLARNRRRKQREAGRTGAPVPAARPVQGPGPVGPENFLSRIRGGNAPGESARADADEASILASFDGLGDEFERTTVIDHGMGGEEEGDYDRVAAVEMSAVLGEEFQTEMGLVRPVAEGGRRTVTLRSRLDRLSPLQKAVVMAEILGLPAALKSPEPPAGFAPAGPSGSPSGLNDDGLSG